MKVCLAAAALFWGAAFAVHASEFMPFGIPYDVPLAEFDNGGAMSTGGVYWHYGAVGQTGGVGILTNSQYFLEVGVLARPIPEPAGWFAPLVCLAALLCEQYSFRRNAS
jgi:hypothetical protein